MLERYNKIAVLPLIVHHGIYTIVTISESLSFVITLALLYMRALLRVGESLLSCTNNSQLQIKNR